MKIRLLSAMFMLCSAVCAQSFTVSSSVEPAQIKIGEQALLKLVVATPQDVMVESPILSDTITAGVEIVQAKADTISLGNNRIQINQEYYITAFDSGFYFIPSYAYSAQGETLHTAPLGLTVSTVAVNAQTDDIKAIKDIMSAPFSWKEFGVWVGYALLALAVVAIIILLLLKFVFKKNVPLIAPQPEPVIPPHIVALNRLEVIKEEKAWQLGNMKAFYTDVTDVLRVYLEGQFAINAMELTSDEILALVKKVPQMDPVRAQLKQLLQMADLVKFAKMIPLENENEANLLIAFEVVEKTKPQEVSEVETQKSEVD